MEPVLFYEGRWYMFSNFSAFSVLWRGKRWMTAEHAYQSAKFEDGLVQALIQYATSAHDAKKIARAHYGLRRPYWPEIKLEVMEDILRAKLEQHPYVKLKLLATGVALIAEDSPTDDFWGWGPDRHGLNWLGRLWMKLRDELTAGTPQAPGS